MQTAELNFLSCVGLRGWGSVLLGWVGKPKLKAPPGQEGTSWAMSKCPAVSKKYRICVARTWHFC